MKKKKMKWKSPWNEKPRKIDVKMREILKNIPINAMIVGLNVLEKIFS